MPMQVQSRPLPLKSWVTAISCKGLCSWGLSVPRVKWEQRLLDSGSYGNTARQEGLPQNWTLASLSLEL